MHPEVLDFFGLILNIILILRAQFVSHGHSGKIEDSFYWEGNRDYAGFISVAKTLTLWRGNENKIYQLLHNRLIE